MADQGFPSWTIAEGAFLLHHLVFVPHAPSDLRLEQIIATEYTTPFESPSSFDVDKSRLMAKVRSLSETQQQAIKEQFQTLHQGDTDSYTTLAAVTEHWAQDQNRETIAPVIRNHLERLGFEVED